VHHRRGSHHQRRDLLPFLVWSAAIVTVRARRSVRRNRRGRLAWRTIEDRKGLLKKLIGNKRPGIAFNKHFNVEGSVVFHHACKLGCEGIVSKRIGSPYRFGHSNDWIKVKNPAAPAVKREADEDWSAMGKRLR
jgi:hypothetical protein